ncbi:MAG TPA: MarR family transcriptional regulator [Croceibacterium sp.]|jgi:DNA-binding MarR family transcriptional regulator
MSKINATPQDPGREFATAVIVFHEALAKKAGLTTAESRCVGILLHCEVATAGELARATGLTTGAITGIVDRLQKAGWVRREDNPTDRRSVLVRLLPNANAKAVLLPGYARLREAMAALMGEFTPQELIVIERYLQGAIGTLQRLTDELR